MPTNPKVTEEMVRRECELSVYLNGSRAGKFGDVEVMGCSYEQARREGWEACREAAAKREDALLVFVRQMHDETNCICKYEGMMSVSVRCITCEAKRLLAAEVIRNLEYPEG